MRFGINTFLWSAVFDEQHFDLLPTIRERGFDGVEVPLFRAVDFRAAEIRRAVDESGLECTVCSVLTPGLSLISDDAQVRRETVEHLKACVAATAEANARIMAGPLYNPVGVFTGRRRTPDEWKRAVEGYRELGPVLAEHNVQLAIEPLNRFETYFLNTTSDAVRLCEEVAHSHVGILWDTFHANIEEKHPSEALLQTGRYLKHVHTCENDRGTPGTGHVDWAGVFGSLDRLGYDGWLTIESFGFAAGALSAAASIWRDLEPTCEEIAWNGVQFLKQQCVAGASR